MGNESGNESWASRVRARYFRPESAGSWTAHARSRRWAELGRRFPDLADMTVVDLGGYPWTWEHAPAPPRHLVVLNLDEDLRDWGPTIEYIQGDACALPAALSTRRFDLVYSNSVIEHVGGRWRRNAFAESVHRLADHHWVQTPARTFPVEPHWLFPGFQFLPLAMRAEVSRRWPLSPAEQRGRDRPAAVEDALSVELLTAAEMRILFPSSELFRERFAGLTKSYVAVR